MGRVISMEWTHIWEEQYSFPSIRRGVSNLQFSVDSVMQITSLCSDVSIVQNRDLTEDIHGPVFLKISKVSVEKGWG